MQCKHAVYPLHLLNIFLCSFLYYCRTSYYALLQGISLSGAPSVSTGSISPLVGAGWSITCCDINHRLSFLYLCVQITILNTCWSLTGNAVWQAGPENCLPAPESAGPVPRCLSALPSVRLHLEDQFQRNPIPVSSEVQNTFSCRLVYLHKTPFSVHKQLYGLVRLLYSRSFST
jgi:hypothetical protein